MTVARIPAATRANDPRWKSLALGAAGPALIVGAVLVVLHDLAFGGALPAPNFDTNSFYLPNHCFLGKSLLAGEIPGWNPFSMSGMPFAGDPQTGWMYLPAMSLYVVMSCEAATRWFIILQPLIAGLAMYWFLRSEGLSRTAATTGGLVAALLMCTSLALIKVWFSASIAWTSALLATGSRFFRARNWPRRIGWAVVVAVAWGQLALAHISHGVVVGTGLFVCFAAMRLASSLRAGTMSLTSSGVAIGLLIFATLSVNLAVLLPRANLYSKTTLGRGYQELKELDRDLRGLPPKEHDDAPAQAYDAMWGLRLAASPGSYAGGVALLASTAWLWTRRNRSLGLAVLIPGIGFYLLSLKTVVSALTPVLQASTLGDIYLHSPDRYMVAIFPVLAVFAALGVDGWLSTSGRARWLMLLTGLGLWGLLPLLAGANPSRLLLFAATCSLTILALLLITRLPRLAFLLPLLVAVDISTSSLLGQKEKRLFVPNGLDHNPSISGFGENFPEPSTDGEQVETPGKIEQRLSAENAGRVVGVGSYSESMIFSVESSEGYNPVLLLWYWAYSRSLTTEEIGRRTAEFLPTQEAALDLLDIRWYRASSEGWEPPGSRPEVSDKGLTLYRLAGSRSRVSVVSDWVLADNAAEARDLVSSSKFRSERVVVLQQDPGFRSEDGRVSADPIYRARGTQAAQVDVTTPVPALVVVRNTYDPHWEALVDGEPAPVLRADYVIQAVRIPAGKHSIELRYDDPSIRSGLIGSAASISLLGLLAGLVMLRGRSRGTGPDRPAPADSASGSSVS